MRLKYIGTVLSIVPGKYHVVRVLGQIPEAMSAAKKATMAARRRRRIVVDILLLSPFGSCRGMRSRPPSHFPSYSSAIGGSHLLIGRDLEETHFPKSPKH